MREIAAHSLLPSLSLKILQGSVVDFRGDAIVNAANELGLRGCGVDGAITSAGGVNLAAAREALPIVRDDPELGPLRCLTGTAVLVGPGTFGSLHTPYVVLAVGPNYRLVKFRDYELDGDQLLATAYKGIVQVCFGAPIRSIGCCLLSSGIFRGSRTIQEVVEIAVDAIQHELEANQHQHSIQEFCFVAYTDAECQALIKCFRQRKWIS